MVGDENPEFPAVPEKDSNGTEEVTASPATDKEEDAAGIVVVVEEDAGGQETSGEQEPAPDPLAELQEKCDKTHERMLRIAADFENFKKRSRRDAQEAAFRARDEVLKEILPVVDNLERALAMATKDGAEESRQSLVEGIEMVLRQFTTAMEKFEVRSFESLGQAFDPNFHEAISQRESEEHSPGSVIEEYRKGYLMGERLIRPAMVVVAMPPAGSGDAASTDAPPETQEPPAE